MNELEAHILSGSYFSLSRLIARLFGRDASLAERNWLEAYFVGVAMYLISYLFAAQHLLGRVDSWQKIAASLALVFAIWICWLIVLYLNSLLIKLLWACGFFRHLTKRRLQDFLIGILITVFALELATADSWLRWVGMIWIAAVILNWVAALFLAFIHEVDAASK